MKNAGNRWYTDRKIETVRYPAENREGHCVRTDHPERAQKASLIVTDAGPLVTLASAGALDTLLLPGIRVVIPDMVRVEVIRHLDKPVAQEISEWIRKNEPEKVYVGTTEVFDVFAKLLLVDPHAKSRSRGEQAALEILVREISRSQKNICILLFAIPKR